MAITVRPLTLATVLSLVLALGFTVEANITFRALNGTTLTLLSVAQKYGQNRRDFSPIAAKFGGLPRVTGAPKEEGMVLALEYRGWKVPYVESIMAEWEATYKPAAIIYFHRNDTDFWGYGYPRMCCERDRSHLEFSV